MEKQQKIFILIYHIMLCLVSLVQKGDPCQVSSSFLPLTGKYGCVCVVGVGEQQAEAVTSQEGRWPGSLFLISCPLRLREARLHPNPHSGNEVSENPQN